MTVRRLLCYGAIYIFWGGSFFAIRQVVAVVPPYFAAAFRFLCAGLILYGYARWRGIAPPSRQQLKSTAIIGLVMFTGNYACLFWSEKFLPTGLASVVTSLIAVWVFLGEWLALRTQKITLATALGTLCGVAGVVLLTVPSRQHHGQLAWAAAVLVLGTFFWSAGTLWALVLPLPPNPMINAALQMTWGGVFLAIFSALAGEFRELPQVALHWKWSAAYSMAYLIVLASVITFTAFVWLMGREPATRVASYAYVNPMIALLLGAVFLHERLNPHQYAGTLLILIGVVATISGRGQPKVLPVEAAA